MARGASIPIGVDTKRVVIVPPDTAANGSLRGDVGCTLYGNHSSSINNPYQKDSLGLGAFKYWTEEEWAEPSARYIDLEPGAVAVWPNRDTDDYDRFDLYCSGSNEDAPFRITRALWRLTPYEAVAPIVTLTPDPATLFSDATIDQYIDRAVRDTVSAGDRIRVIGPANSWPALDDSSASVKTVVTGVPGNPAGLDPSVDAAGATLAFTVPTIPAAATPYSGGFLVNTLSTRNVGATSVQKSIMWTSGARLTPAARSASTTTLSLRPTLTLSLRPTRTCAGLGHRWRHPSLHGHDCHPGRWSRRRGSGAGFFEWDAADHAPASAEGNSSGDRRVLGRRAADRIDLECSAVTGVLLTSTTHSF